MYGDGRRPKPPQPTHEHDNPHTTAKQDTHKNSDFKKIDFVFAKFEL